ncbi:relaxin receptor 2 isoform X2 [Strongylocentrotus purpuratus]|uniref:G-protein coupled receptors family 1 profile domain-containing protein n=1 Tax=Strongylocentrotus purpuratus TaxID=7668 RepID=A0A7M7PG85_STRPU|nr:relaxin receptor 2 isoform X2 [Strongylocentrotus purpuratus]
MNWAVLMVVVSSFFGTPQVSNATKGDDLDDAPSLIRYRRQSPMTSDPHAHCGEWFPCINSTQCVPQEAICNGIFDCDNKMDESDEECIDDINRRIYTFKDQGKQDDSSEEEDFIPPACDAGTYPDVCRCVLLHEDPMVNFDYYESLQDVYPSAFADPLFGESGEPMGLEIACTSKQLDRVPEALPADTLYLDLSDNRITHLHDDSFKNLTMLRELVITHNQMQTMDEDVFYDTTSLEMLDLSDNLIEIITAAHFDNLQKLTLLRLSRNHFRCEGGDCFRNLVSLRELELVACGITELTPDLFSNLHSLSVLQLSYNAITEIIPSHMNGLERLQDLYLSSNHISNIEHGTFDGMDNLLKLLLHDNKLTNISVGIFPVMPELQILKLDENEIAIIEPGSFALIENVQHFTLMKNRLSRIEVGMFDGLGNVTDMSLLENEIKVIEENAFDNLIKLESLDLQKNKLTEVPRELFTRLKNLNNIYFDFFFMCGYAPNVRVCLPKGDGISNVDDLLGNWLLRGAVWLVALLGCFGNLMVIFARCFVSEDNKVHSFFIMNLAVADFLMGLYLLIIGLHDVMFRGEYIFKDLDWRSGWVCKMCGLLSLLSSEMSVLTLTVITSDRFISIVHPFKFRQRHLAHAVILMVGFWLAAMLIAILPVLHRNYFGEFFYGGNGVCLPLQFDRPFDHGWEFTLVVFVLFNLFAFLFILYAYAQMFATVRKSSLAMRSTKESQDWNLLKRFTIIVATDFICWMPIILVKIASYSGIAIPQSVHAWFAIFVLPVNSALNPILYTVTTQFFRQRFLRPIRRLCGRRKQGKTYQSGSYDDSITGTKISATKLSVISHNGKPRAGSVNGRLISTKR